MTKLQKAGMQSEAPRQIRMCISVYIIPHNWAAQRSQVHPNLMRSACFQAQTKERAVFCFPLHPVMGYSAFPVGPDFAFHPLPRFGDGQVDHPFRRSGDSPVLASPGGSCQRSFAAMTDEGPADDLFYLRGCCCDDWRVSHQ